MRPPTSPCPAGNRWPAAAGGRPIPLYILPHAGGAAYAYRALAAALPPGLQGCCLDLPGHGRRAGEAPLADMRALAEDLVAALPAADAGPWALFGHSMGALLAHAICHECRQRGYPLPVHLFVSGTAAPGKNRLAARIAHLPSEPFWEAVAGYGGVPAEIMRVPELRDYFEELLRQDFRAVAGYVPATAPLPLPITVFYGQDDMDWEEATSWRTASEVGVEVHAFGGGHFFLFEAVTAIGRRLGQALLGARGPDRDAPTRSGPAWWP